MARKKHHHKKKNNPIIMWVLYIVVIVLLLAGLCFFYLRNRAQKADFQEMKKQAASQETLRKLEPKAQETQSQEE
jgi:flagellar basal body-associated protein FliL